MENTNETLEAVDQRKSTQSMHTAMLTLCVMFSAGSFGLLWNDHEKIWDHEVRIKIIEQDGNQHKQTSCIQYNDCLIPDECKIECVK